MLSSCVTKKNITLNFIAPPKNAIELRAIVDSKNNHTKWINLKGKAHIVKKDMDITLSINIKNRKDSIIWISASGPFSIEIFRAQLTPDSIYFVNRINKTYLIEPFIGVKDFINSELSFYDLQEMITANLKISKKNYKFEVDEFGFYLVSDNASYSFNNNYRLQSANLNGNKNSLEFILEDYSGIDNYPRKLILKSIQEEGFVATINYSKVEFNIPQFFSFKIPPYYNEIK